MKEQTVNTQAQGEYPELPEPALFTHELLENKRKGSAPGEGIHLGTNERSIAEQAHTPGETSEEIYGWFSANQVYAAIDADRALRNQVSGEPVATVEVIEVDDPHLKPAHHVALHVKLPHGTKLYTRPAPSPEVVEALLALGDDAAVHIWPDDLEECSKSECVVKVYSVRVGSPEGKTVPLFSIEQIRAALRSLGGEQK